MSILHDIQPSLHYTGAAAGQTLLEPSEGVDTLGFSGVAFLVCMGAISADAVTSIYAEMSDDDGVLDAWESVKDSSVTIPDDGDGQIYALDVNHPAKRYVRCCVSRGTEDSAVIGIVAISYNPTYRPVALGKNTASLSHLAEGFAGDA